MSAAQLLITQIGIVAGIQVMVTVRSDRPSAGSCSLASLHRAYAVGAVAAGSRCSAACSCDAPPRTRAPARGHRRPEAPQAVAGSVMRQRGHISAATIGGRRRRLEGHQLGDVPLDLASCRP